MPPQVELPPGFTDLDFEDEKLPFVFEALTNQTYLAKLIEWLKDPERPHNTEEDEKNYSLHAF